ncbi:DUF1761 domain-containing protein [Pseudooceanicola sp.]|uniref:DUF1761 domain-containing protein n=1 Tax=Pseudooceanicola sp. TaxID=1914328 RepID=UPI00261DD98F|nr:DUF1761 domain-containing protein [Pseudooceanicola sp.]MDF1857017.1 DUF1761 domain-containing protein [Pseudooceanicola sp.]
MSYLAVLASAAAGFGIGALWYMTFAGAWMKAAGIETDDKGQPVADGSFWSFVVSGICMILVAGMMRHVFAMAGIDGIKQSLVAGLGVGAFFITPWVTMNYAYAMRPKVLSVIDGGYAIFGCGAIGLVLGLF